jgi:hypothetical protein
MSNCYFVKYHTYILEILVLYLDVEATVRVATLVLFSCIKIRSGLGYKQLNYI